jgi:hypothetical protein
MKATEQLTAFEFVAARTDEPCVVRLLAGDEIVSFLVIGWLGVDLRKLEILLERRDLLVIEGQGLGRPYWGEDLPPWMAGADPVDELPRIGAIRAAAHREINRAALSVL